MAAPDVHVRVETNGLGTAGFVTSLVGLFVCCGWLSPIGLAFSLLALFRQPRGMAIAGTVLGGIGSLWLAFFGAAFVLGLVGFKSGVEISQTLSVVHDAHTVIKEQYRQTGVVPDDTIGGAAIEGFVDSYSEKQVRYKRISDVQWEVRSAGADGAFDTADDLKWDTPVDPQIDGPPPVIRLHADPAIEEEAPANSEPDDVASDPAEEESTDLYPQPAPVEDADETPVQVRPAAPSVDDETRRVWISADGKSSTTARFVSLTNGVVKLRKDNGAIVAVPVEKLSPEDRAYLDDLKKQKLRRK